MRRAGALAGIVVAVLAIGCAGDDGATGQASGESEAATGEDPNEQDPDGSEPAGSADASFDEDLLDGVPATCELLVAHDPRLHERFVDAMGGEVAHGPFVIVPAEGSDVVATTTYERPGVEGPSALWRVAGDDIEAINEEAGRLSGFEVDLVDTAGTDAVARAMAEAEDCSWVAADRSAEDPPEPEPQMRDDLLVIEPADAAPGERIELHFPERTERGVAFHLERRTGDGWETTHWMTSDANGGEPVTVPVGTEGFGWPDVGISGPGPDGLALPEELAPGSYRVCTANARVEFCAPLTVES